MHELRGTPAKITIPGLLKAFGCFVASAWSGDGVSSGILILSSNVFVLGSFFGLMFGCRCGICRLIGTPPYTRPGKQTNKQSSKQTNKQANKQTV